MTRQLEQVAYTYLTRRSLWWVLAAGLVGIAPSAILALVPDRNPSDRLPFLVFSVGFATGIIGWILVTQAKWHFCDQRARLMPGYAAPHVTMLAAIAIVGLGVYPLAIGLLGPMHTFGLAACAIGIGSCYIWSAQSGSRLFGALAMVQFFSLMFPHGREFWTATGFTPFHAAILISGWIAVFAWLRRLATMREEDSDYFIPAAAHQGSATRMERTQASRTAARALVRSSWQRGSSDWWHDRLASARAPGTPQRQRLLRYGFAATPTWISAIFMSITFFVMFFAMAQSGFMRSGGPTQSILPSLTVMIIMPMMTAGGLLTMRRGRMAQELFLPLTRRDYFSGLLAAVGRCALVNWLVVHLAVLALLALTSPEMMTLSFVIGLTALSFAVQVCAFGVMTRVAQITSGGKRIVAMTVAMMTAVIPLTIGMQFLGHPGETREEAVARAVADEAHVDASLPADIREQITADPRRIANTRRNAEVSWERTQPWSPAWLWSTVALTVAAGAGLTQNSRNRWMQLELG